MVTEATSPRASAVRLASSLLSSAAVGVSQPDALPPQEECAGAAEHVEAAKPVVLLGQAALLLQEECAGAANARSAQEAANAEQADCGWAPAVWWNALPEQNSFPAGYSAGLGGLRRSLDALPALLPLAGLRHGWLQVGYKSPQSVWPVQLHCRVLLRAWE
jgi:hypothetical protein